VSWVSVIPDVLVCAGLFFAPGLLVTYLGGLRGITAWATAPLVTVAVVTGVALLGGFFGFRFGLWPAAVGIVIMAGLSAGLSVLLRARGIERPPRDPARYSLAVALGAIAGAVIGGVTFVTGVRRPDAISQSWDSVYHYNAVRYIEQTGHASPLTIGTLGQPGAKQHFYPDAWHAMAALLAELTGASVPVAAMVICLVIAALVWPLSCLLLARHLFGASGVRAAAAVVITGMLSSLFGAFPWMLTGAYGVLWPNALGMALAPAGVALGMSMTRNSDADTFGGVRRWFFGIAGAWAIGVSHPNSALSVAVICAFPLLLAVGPHLIGQYRRHALRTSLVLIGLVALAGVGVAFASRLPAVRHVESVSWKPTETPSQAVVSAVSNSTNGQLPELLLATFLIIGVVACFVWRQRRWLVSAELLIVALYVGAAASGSHLARLFTGLWYDDSYRIAATLPIVAIPLTTTGVIAAGEWLSQLIHRAGSAAAVAASPALALAVPLALGAAATAATAVQSVPHNVRTVGLQFNTSGDEKLVSPSKIQFLRTVARLVPPSALVADNPFDGTAYLFAMSGTRVMYPQLTPSVDEDVNYLAQNLVHLRQDPRACDLVRRYGVGYMVIAPDNFRAKYQLDYYAGVADPAPGPGFQLIASDGPDRLYKITVCQSAGQPAGQVAADSPGSG
jgi:hypothetical protein